MTNRELSKKLGKLVSYREDLKEIVDAGVIHTGIMSGSCTLTFEGGVLVVPFRKSKKTPKVNQTLGQALKIIKWTIKEVLESNNCVISGVKKTKKEKMNEKAIEILKKEMEKSENKEINVRYFVITKIRKKIEGYGLYGGVYEAEPWEALYELINERYDYFGTSQEERDYLDMLMHNKVVGEYQRSEIAKSKRG